MQLRAVSFERQCLSSLSVPPLRASASLLSSSVEHARSELDSKTKLSGERTTDRGSKPRTV